MLDAHTAVQVQTIHPFICQTDPRTTSLSVPSQRCLVFSLSSSSWEGSCRCARPPSVLPQVAPVSTSMSPPAAAQSRAQGSPGPARQGWEPRGAHPLSVTPWGLLVWSDTPDPPHLLALGLRAPSPGARAHPHPTQRQTDVSGGGFRQPVTCWGLPEAFPEKGCVYSMGTTT